MDDYYARSNAAEGIHKIMSDVGMALDKNLDDFRNKKLFDFGFTEPNKIEMHIDGKSYGFQKGGEDWFSNGKKVDNLSVQSMLDKLRDLSAVSFVDFTALAPPATDITVVSNDNKRTEKVLISKQGADFIAKRDNEPSLYKLDPKAVDEISKAASDVKPAEPAKKK
jgi:hypothetical protein